MRFSPRFLVLLALPLSFATAKQVDPFLKVEKGGQITYRANEHGDRVPDFSSAVDGNRARVASNSRRAASTDVPGESRAITGRSTKLFGSGRAESGVQSAAP